MTEDRILRELGHLAKEEKEAEQARLDERWDRMSAGTLTPQEDAELQALAKFSPEAHETYEAFRPLGAEFQARVVDEIAAEIEKATPEVEPRKTRPRVLPFRPATLRRVGWVTAAAAAAAVLAVYLLPPVPLPRYSSLEISGGSRAMRGEEIDATEVPDFAPGDGFRAILRPETEAGRVRSLEAQALLLRDGELRQLDVRSHFEPNGVVKLEGSLATDLRAGDWILWAVVGRRGELPGSAELQALSGSTPVRRRDWVAVPKNVRIRPQAP